MPIVETIIHLLPIVFVEYQELKLISSLNNFFNFDHNIFLLDSSADINRFISTQEVTAQSLYVFESVNDNITGTGLDGLTEINSKNTLLVVVSNDANLHRNLNLFKRVKDIQQLQINIKIGMFFPHFASSDDLKTLFEWCKELLIVDIFAATYEYPDVVHGLSTERLLNIFTFHPFGAFDHLTNLTGSESYDSYFPSLNSNFQQHQLLVTDFLQISDQEFWYTVFRLMNASFTVTTENDTEITEDTEILFIDVFTTPYQMIEWTVDAVYPLGMINHVIIVPDAMPYSGFSAYLRTVTSDEFFGYSAITIAIVMLILSVIRCIKKKKILLFQSLADVLNLLMNDNGYIKYQQLSCAEVFLIVPLTFVGFILVNGILSSLESHLTRPVLQPQINTIDDVYRSQLPILTSSEGWKSALADVLTNSFEHEDWRDKIIVAEDEEKYDEQLYTYNTTTTILTSQKLVNTLIRLQKRRNIKGFRNPKIQMFIDVSTYSVNPKFLFVERLNEIVHRIQSAGLYDLWLRRDESELENEILKRNQKESVVENFEIPILIVYGWLVGVIMLVIEIIWKKYRLSRIRTFPRNLAQKIRQFYNRIRGTENCVKI